MSEKKKSVYSGIADDIIDKIKNNVYPIGSLLPPEREFMKIFSVQRTTVRRGLDILSEQGYIKKVAGLGSVVKSTVPAPKDASDKSPVHKEKDSHDNSYCILLPKADSVDKLPKLAIDLLSALGKSGAGFMTANTADIEDSARVIALDSNPGLQNPTCLCLCQSDEKRSVILDNDKGAYVALSYLEELGHTKIAYIGTSEGSTFENAAYDAFCAVNSFLDEELINLAGADEKGGFDGFSELFRRHGGKFTSICTVNDEVAKGVIKAAKYYKIRVPEDVSVISLCSSTGSSVDCIYYNPSDLAEEILCSADASSRVSTVLFGGNLVTKGSCASIKQGSGSGKKMSDFLL